MSFYRMFIAAVAAMGLSTAVLAEESTTNAAQAPAAPAAASTTQKVTTMADASSATATAPEASQPAADSAAKVNVNKATAKELAQVKGMNASKAKAIVAYRKKHGEFKSLDDLKDVKGFKKMDEKTMKDLQDQLTAG